MQDIILPVSNSLNYHCRYLEGHFGRKGTKVIFILNVICRPVVSLLPIR